MFIKTYKTTLKNLVRSLLFWVALAIVIFVAFHYIMNIHSTSLDSNSGEVITDLDSRYVMNYYTYLLIPMNVFSFGVMLYCMPIFTVISTMLVMNRNYGDGFFEIEKAGGIKPSTYFFGRITALITVNLAVALIISFAGSLTYYYIRGGYAGFTAFGSFLADFSARFFRIYIIAAVPVILLYMGLTYMVGSLFKNGFPGVVMGLGTVLLTYVFNRQLRFRMPEVYNKYMNPLSANLYFGLSYYKTGEFVNDPEIFKIGDVLLWLSIILGTAIFCFIVSYICTCRRKF